MKKVLLINDYISSGGVENIMLEFAKFLTSREYDVTIYTKYRQKEFYSLYPKKVKYTYCYFHRFKKRSIISKIVNTFGRINYKLLLYRKYDIVINMKEGPTMHRALRYKNADKLITWLHIDYSKFHWTNHFFDNDEDERKCYAKFDTTIAVSNAVENGLIETIGDPGNIVVRYNPIDKDSIIKKSNNLCDVVKDEKKVLFVSVGRLCNEKRYKELVLEMAKREYNELLEFWIIGNGEDKYTEELCTIIEENCLCGVVKLLGRKDNPFPYVKQADFYVCSSYTESFGLAIHEALVLGVPVLTINCPGIVESLNEKVAIITHDIEELCDRIQEIIYNRNIAEEYRQKVLQYYECVSAKERFEEIEKIL